MGNKLTYKKAGVDIHAGSQLVNRIKPIAAETYRKGMLSSIGGFGALFELPLDQYQQPVLVSSTDGVGTKLKLAIEMDKHDTIGIDLVAMCVNDVIVQGAQPLFFLDYFATSKLDLVRGESIITGIAKGCKEAGVALAGGETAEMPGIYANNDYDLAGFVVGVVEKQQIITGQKVTPGNILIALPSSGLHSNGYSLVREIISLNKCTLNSPFGKCTLGEVLLTPTRIYVKAILELIQAVQVNALAHITGGGIVENLPRVLPDFTQAILDTQSWQIPEIFNWLQAKGNIDSSEMWKTFNCGVGMIICINKQDYANTMKILEKQGEKPWMIGEIMENSEQIPSVSIK